MPTRVLIVEDEDTVRELLAEYLRGRGLLVVERRTAAEGVRMLSDQPFDLLVTDLKLPDGDGLDLVRSAVARPSPPACVVMSGYATVDDAISALTHGAVDLILKPFRLRDAHEALQRALLRGAEERGRRVTDVALRWLESAVQADTPEAVEALLPALRALLTAWSPHLQLEVAEGPGTEGWDPLGPQHWARLIPPDDRARLWVRALHQARVRVGL